MELLRDVGHVEPCFDPFGDGVSSMQHSCIVCAKCIIASKSFWTHPMVLLGDEAQVQASFGPFRDSANLDIDRCMV